MSEIHHFVHIFRLSVSDRLVMILTFALTVLVDLTVAIGVGVTLASLLFMHEMSQSASWHSQGRHIHDTEDASQRDDLPEGVEVFRMTGPLFFGMAGAMIDTMKAMGVMPKILILRMKHVPYMDVAGLKALTELIAICGQKDCKIIISGLHGQPEKMLARTGVRDDGNQIFMVKKYDNAIALSLELSQGQN